MSKLEQMSSEKKTIDLGKWLQYYAFDVYGEITFSHLHFWTAPFLYGLIPSGFSRIMDFLGRQIADRFESLNDEDPHQPKRPRTQTSPSHRPRPKRRRRLRHHRHHPRRHHVQHLHPPGRPLQTPRRAPPRNPSRHRLRPHHLRTKPRPPLPPGRHQRWMTDDRDQLSRMERGFFPFGPGSRTCIGKNISLLEMGKVIPQLVKGFDFEVVDEFARREGRLRTRNWWFVKQSGFWAEARERVV
ncbi:hypothetical protein KVT40_008705 [Elsinoe batatas]|uniref:Cytochrome P450 n=1 Tax=Elsinoe batatas TaxID=2601811 RepID=A0A8K0PFN4_9PEZI|nr:hypothetical protein KVT40_008705 [Elsinoe batatas]